MRGGIVYIGVFLSVLFGCSGKDIEPHPTIASLQNRVANLEPATEFKIDGQQVINSYRALMKITEDNAFDGDVLRRLSDLELEASLDNQLSDNASLQQIGEREAESAIRGYETYLQRFPKRKDNDLILYQLSRAYAMKSEPQKSMQALNQLTQQFPDSSYIDEVEFRRGENLFVLRRYADAENAYAVVVNQHPGSVFYEKALYKFGWSQFKQNRNREALDSYVELLDHYAEAGKIKAFALSENLSRGDRELLEDVIKITSLAFSYEAENLSMRDYFKSTGLRNYEPLLYKSLGELYLSKDRIADAADTYLAYTRQYPLSPYAPELHQQTIALYQSAGYRDLVLKEKKVFVNRYDIGTRFWQQQDQSSKQLLSPLLAKHLRELATHYHARARLSKKQRDYQVSASWYRRFLKSFPSGPASAEVNFLLAESLIDAGDLTTAIHEYEKTAYNYPPHKNAAEAGYAALVSYVALRKISSRSRSKPLDEKRMLSALRFASHFPDDKRVPAVLLQTAEYYFADKRYSQAITTAYRLTEKPLADKKTKQSAWTIIAYSQYASEQFANAEKAFLKLLPNLDTDQKQRSEVRELIAASIYKQGEAARNKGDFQMAANQFSRLGRVIPESPKRVVAEYDAAAAYIELRDWPTAIALLQTFRKRYPANRKFKTGVSEKLALAYSQNGNQSLAANEMMSLADSSTSVIQKRDLMWSAAGLYEKAGNKSKTISVYKAYVKAYPQPLDRSIELRHRIAEYYRAEKNHKSKNYWLGQIVSADARGKNQRSERSRYLAATASMELVQPLHRAYRKAKLTVPLKKSLGKKKKLMQQSIDAYDRALKYQVAEVTTQATYHIAEIYHDFARALLESQRPKGLDADALEEYDLLLEEQAYPFEEKSIDIHLANFKRIPTGTYDQPVKDSLRVLGELMPFRYAKMEQVEAYVELP